jgi:hypothetical protein
LGGRPSRNWKALPRTHGFGPKGANASPCPDKIASWRDRQSHRRADGTHRHTSGISPSGPPPTATISDQDLFKQARQAVVASVKDPDSVKFGPQFERRVHSTRSGQPYEIVCGQVKAKNSFGGYTGMKMFAWTASDLGEGQRVHMDEGHELERIVTKNLCLGTTDSKHEWRWRLPSAPPPPSAAKVRLVVLSRTQLLIRPS